MPIQVVIHYSQSKVETKILQLDKKKSVFTLSTDLNVEKVELDPDNWVLMNSSMNGK